MVCFGLTELLSRASFRLQFVRWLDDTAPLNHMTVPLTWLIIIFRGKLSRSTTSWQDWQLISNSIFSKNTWPVVLRFLLIAAHQKPILHSWWGSWSNTFFHLRYGSMSVFCLLNSVPYTLSLVCLRIPVCLCHGAHEEAIFMVTSCFIKFFKWLIFIKKLHFQNILWIFLH